MLGCPDPDSGYNGGPYVYGFNIGESGDYCDGMDESHLTTTVPFNCIGLSHVCLRFKRWLGVGWPPDKGYLRVSNITTVSGFPTDPDDWVTVWGNPVEVADCEWVEMELYLSELADDRPQVWLRWTMGPTNSHIWGTTSTYCGWNIDDIELLAVLTDCNENGIQDVQDIADCDPNEPACQDCNENNVPDGCDITSGTSQDANENGVPDECE